MTTTYGARLGHPSIQLLKLLEDFELLNKCHVYPLAKQTRLPFPISETKSSLCFDAVRMDLRGPIKHLFLIKSFTS